MPVIRAFQLSDHDVTRVEHGNRSRRENFVKGGQLLRQIDASESVERRVHLALPFDNDAANEPACLMGRDTTQAGQFFSSNACRAACMARRCVASTVGYLRS